MTAMRFVDTNVLIYAVSRNESEATKTERALALLWENDLAFSVQVFQEFYAQVTRKNRIGALSHRDAVEFLESLTRFHVEPITLAVVRAAFDIRRKFKLSYWDSAILAAAKACGCDRVFSEDLSAEQSYGGIRVVNPFE
jgi:predicted nucleic acid-binding protein